MSQNVEILEILLRCVIIIIKEIKGKEMKGKATNLFCKVLELHIYN